MLKYLTRLNSIKSKIVLLVCGSSLVTTLLLSGIFYYYIYTLAIEQANERVRNETKLIAQKFTNLYKDLEHDVSMVLYTPPIQGIIRSTDNYDVDPVEDSTMNQWRHRLESIFKSIMAHNKAYTQLRYIGIRNNGREIVRVNRESGNTLKVVPTSKLQQKANEFYFREALKLKSNQIYFSPVTLNREYGRVSPDDTYTIRAITPVFNNDVLFGFIVINADYPELLHSITREIAPSDNIIVINDDDSYFEYDAEQKKYYYSNKINANDSDKDYINFGVNLIDDEANYYDDTNYIYYIREKINHTIGNTHQYITVGLQLKNSKLLDLLIH